MTTTSRDRRREPIDALRDANQRVLDADEMRGVSFQNVGDAAERFLDAAQAVVRLALAALESFEPPGVHVDDAH